MINTLLERFNSLSTREKIISLSTLLVLFWGIWDNLIYQPITTEQKRLNLELTNLNNNLTVNQQVAIQLEALGKIDPNKENKQSLKKIKLELKKLKLQLETGNKKFVPAHLMTEVLQDMLRQNKGLKLISLKTLAITTLSENKQLKSWIYPVSLLEKQLWRKGVLEWRETIIRMAHLCQMMKFMQQKMFSV